MKKVVLLSVFFSLSAQAGYYTTKPWKKKNISVCFGTTPTQPMKAELVPGHEVKYNIKPWIASMKETVKSIISTEYTAARTGIFFTGWQDCPKVPAADVILFLNHNRNPITMIFGAGLEGSAGNVGPYKNIHPDYPGASNYIIFSSSSMKKEIIVHEFGHVAGLDHEHNHPSLRAGQCEFASPETIKNRKVVTYDPQSVMNYCWMLGSGAKGRGTGLSPADVRNLKTLYP